MTLSPIHVNPFDDGMSRQCQFCGCPLDPGDRAYQVGDDGPLFCSVQCSTFAAEPRKVGTVKVQPY